MVLERQLSILGPDGCIVNDLSHESCLIEGPKIASKAIDVIDVR